MTRYRRLRGEFLTLVQSFLLFIGTHQLKHRRRLVDAIGNRSLAFERGTLGVVGLFVVTLMVAAYLRPPVDIARASTVAVTPAPVAPVTTGPVSVRSGVTSQNESGLGGLMRGIGRGFSNLIGLHLPEPQVTATALHATFTGIGYDFQAVLAGETHVPRLFLASLPQDLSDLPEVRLKKALFLQSMLPLILQVNDEILMDRERLSAITRKRGAGKRLSATDRLWLASAAERYDVDRDDIAGLTQRMDVVPVSLALAQAASESGWGTSRFAKDGNALFGEWTFSDDVHGLVPEDREHSKTHRVRAFPSLLDSVRAYVDNLNTHGAYNSFRKLRAQMRRSSMPLDGMVLAGALTRYSERGTEYVEDIRTIISANGLDALDRARLAKEESLI